jgi:hypothetical protein
MNGMFAEAIAFNRDLSTWCVDSIATVPPGFDEGATLWTRPRPVWGECPSTP